MATIQGVTNFVQHSVYQTKWILTSGSDTGTSEELSRFPFHSVQISGAAFGGATVVLEGSDDNVTFFTLTGENPAGGSDSLISATSSNRWDFNTVAQYIRPRSTGGTSATITVILTSRSYGH